jgi:hypothetical protein
MAGVLACEGAISPGRPSGCAVSGLPSSKIGHWPKIYDPVI